MGAATHFAVIEDGELGPVDNDDYAAAEASAASGTWQAVPPVPGATFGNGTGPAATRGPTAG
jgi:hypothetical protein